MMRMPRKVKRGVGANGVRKSALVGGAGGDDSKGGVPDGRRIREERSTVILSGDADGQAVRRRRFRRRRSTRKRGGGRTHRAADAGTFRVVTSKGRDGWRVRLDERWLTRPTRVAGRRNRLLRKSSTLSLLEARAFRPHVNAVIRITNGGWRKMWGGEREKKGQCGTRRFSARPHLSAAGELPKSLLGTPARHLTFSRRTALSRRSVAFGLHRTSRQVAPLLANPP